MGDLYEIGLWMTDSLESNGGVTALQRAKTYIEGAINGHTEHDVLVTIRDTVSAPTEKTTQEFHAQYPCSSDYQKYLSLANWWGDYFVGCGRTRQRDCDLLITDRSNGGGTTVYDHYSTAEASEIKNLPSEYTLAGSSTAFTNMNTVLHELGHSLQSNTQEHYVGSTITVNGVKYGTPFCSPEYRQVCTGAEPETFDYRGAMRYSECCEDQMNHTGSA